LPLRNDEYWPAHDHSHDHSHEHKHESTQDDHHHPHPALDGANMDAHLWLDTDNAQHIVNAIAAHLTQLDPIHAEQYAANAQALTQRLAQLTIFIQNRLKGLKNQPFLVFHDAYQYFEQQFNLQALGTITQQPHVPLSLHNLTKIQAIINKNNVQCLFQEPEFNQKMINNLVQNTSLKSQILDPLASQAALGPNAYFEMMENLALTFENCLTPQKK
jgi:zinc transport system substrate-binding protein